MGEKSFVFNPGKMEKRIDELEKKVKSLEERIAALERGQGIGSISLKRG